jgi:hypothetical protein
MAKKINEAKKEKLIQRTFEIIPGALTWTTILLPVWLGFIYPQGLAFVITFLSVYWVYKAITGFIGLTIGYNRFKREMATDWMKEIKNLKYKDLPGKDTRPDSIKKTKHFILVPAVNEPEAVLRPALESFMNQTYPLKNVTLIYTLEEKYTEQTTKLIHKILGDKINDFEEVLIYTHPKGIPGEAIGAGAANRTWGAKRAVEHFEAKNKTIKNYIFSTFDADHVLDPQYLARLTHLYLNTKDRNNKFYSTSVPLFNNNHWRVPAVMRIEANFVTAGTLAARSIPFNSSRATKDTAAAYSSSLQTLIDADYWDVSLGVDDTIFFWRAFFARDGYFELESHYIPYSADAVEADTYIGSYKSLYKQLLRWGWGVIEVPYSMKEFIKNKKIPFELKLLWAYDHLKTRVFLVNVVFIMTFGISIAAIVNPEANQITAFHQVPTYMSAILTFALFFIIPTTILRSKVTKPLPEDWPFWRKLFTYSEGFLVIINLLTFSFFPFVDAQTRMMLGKKLKDLYHTPKVR